MITLVHGIVKELSHQSLTLEVNGIGFGITVPNEQHFIIDQEYTVYIYFNWHAENGPQLYGFTSKLAKQAFGLIISCSGIGPKIGLTVLSTLTPEQFIQAITLGDIKLLSSISGIGGKKAELLLTCLRDKVAKFDNTLFTSNTTLMHVKQLTEALSSLGYSRAEIAAALDVIKPQLSEKSTFDGLLRKALSSLVRGA